MNSEASDILKSHPLFLKAYRCKPDLPCQILAAKPIHPLPFWQKMEVFRYVVILLLTLFLWWINGVWFFPIIMAVFYFFSYSKAVFGSEYALPLPFIGGACCAVPVITLTSDTLFWQGGCVHFKNINRFGIDGGNLFIFDHSSRSPVLCQLQTMTLLMMDKGVFYRLPMHKLVHWLNTYLVEYKAKQ